MLRAEGSFKLKLDPEAAGASSIQRISAKKYEREITYREAESRTIHKILAH